MVDFIAFGVFLAIALVVLFSLYVKTDNKLIGVLGYAADVVLNVVYLSIVFLDWPRELTVTRRLRRYLDLSTPGGVVFPRGYWRWRLADVIADQINRIDPGHV